MFPPTAPPSILKKKKCVRFDDRVTVIEIAERRMETRSDRFIAAKYNSSGARTSAISSSVHKHDDIISLSASSKRISQRPRYRNSRRGPNRMPLKRFNSSPVLVPAKSSLLLPARSYSDHHWRRPDGGQLYRLLNSSLPTSVPTRLPSISNATYDCALAIAEGKHHNYVLNHCDVYHVLGTKYERWKEVSQTPPKIPRRKISFTSF